MNPTKLAIAVALSIPLLTGCQEEKDPDIMAAATNKQEIDAQVRQKIAQEDKELKEELTKLQAKDPAVKDMYYNTGENGQKEVVIVREVVDKTTGHSSMVESVFPMMAGMMLGQMMASSMMMNAMAMSQMGNYGGGGYSGYRSRSYPSSEYRNHRNTARSNYNSSVRNTTAKAYNSSRPVARPSVGARSSGIFSSGSSARSSGYSAGG